MRTLRALWQSWKRALAESSSRQRERYDVNAQSDQARRNQFLYLTDKEYSERFHPDKRQGR